MSIVSRSSVVVRQSDQSPAQATIRQPQQAAQSPTASVSVPNMSLSGSLSGAVTKFQPLVSKTQPGLFECRILYARDLKSYAFKVPGENTVSDSIAIMTEQIFSEKAKQDELRGDARAPRRVTTTCIPDMPESAQVSEWSAQNLHQPPVLLLEAQGEPAGAASGPARLNADPTHTRLYEQLEQQTAVLRNQAQHIEDLHRRAQEEDAELQRACADLASSVRQLQQQRPAG